MDNLNLSLSLFNRISIVIRADLISERFEVLRLQIVIIWADQKLSDERKDDKIQHVQNDRRRLRDELIKYQVEQYEQKQKIMREWKNSQTPDDVSKNSEKFRRECEKKTEDDMTKKQSLQNWKIPKKPTYAGNAVIVELELPAIEDQSTNETVELQSTSEIHKEESSIRGPVVVAKNLKLKRESRNPN